MTVNAQKSFFSIDNDIRNLYDSDPRTLSVLLTENYSSEREKVRAIFSWIVQNIRYNTGIVSKRKNINHFPVWENDPDTSIWASANEMTARQVIKRRIAICDGYSKLFQVLCEYSGIESKIILGFARSGFNDRNKFMTNHSWNAVKIDSQRYLLDATWGAGYLNYFDEYVQRIEEKYFLANPQHFIEDHYPEDLYWTLLNEVPVPKNYKNSPFKFKSFIKYNFSGFYPAGGIIEALPGDTLEFVLNLDIKNKNRSVSPDPFFDEAIFLNNIHSDFIEPIISDNNKLVYRYVLPEGKSWVNLLFNKDLVLRYSVQPPKNHLSGTTAD